MNVVSIADLRMEIPVFLLDGGEMYHIARHVYGLQFGVLSPFRGQPEGGSELSEEGKALIDDLEFKEMYQVLADPDFRLSFRSGGPTGSLGAFTVFGRRWGKPLLVLLEKSGEGVSSLLFNRADDCGAYLSARYACGVALKPVNLIKNEVPAEFLVFAFNLADCYRRAYLNNMLAYSLEPIEGVFEDEFVAVLERELRSSDPRWLVPSLFQLLPSLKEREWQFSKNEVDIAEAMDFISRAASPADKRPIFLLGNSGKYWGLEFSLYWRRSLGLETWALDRAKGATVKGPSYYMAFSDEANHLMVLREEGVSLQVIHRALTADEIASELSRIIGDCLQRA